jgi:hypothetical protein
MLREAGALLTTVLTGFYLIGLVVDIYYVHKTGQHVVPPLANLFSIWAVPLILPVNMISYMIYHNESNMRRRGCQAAPLWPQRDQILGRQWIKELEASHRENRFLELMDKNFKNMGNSYWARSFGLWVFSTCEPENMKSILSLDMESWPIVGPRQWAIEMALGPGGILSVNGKAWHDARALIRPTFQRNQIADLACFDRHVSNLIAQIPRDGSPIDMQKLFYLMTIDAATDFM